MKTKNLPGEAVFYFHRNEYDWNIVKKYTLEDCLSEDVVFDDFNELENIYNSADYSDWICDYYIRIFCPQDKVCYIYVWIEEVIELTDDRKCVLCYGNGSSMSLYENLDGEECELSFNSSKEIPQEIFNELCATNKVKKVTINEFEQMHANEDYYIAASVKYNP